MRSRSAAGRGGRAKATRARLVVAAGQALIDGTGDFEMGDLARRAEVSEGLPYHHFGSKAGAVSAVVDDFYDRYHAVLNRDVDDALPWAEREQERLRGTIEFLYDEPLAPIVLGRLSRNLEVAAVEAARQAEVIDLARRNIETGQRSGEIPAAIDSGIAAAAIMGAIREVTNHILSRPTRPPVRPFADQLWALIAGALGLSAGSSKQSGSSG